MRAKFFSLHAQHKTIESVLQRGEKLDNLVERSNALSTSTKAFYKTAKKVQVKLFYHSADIHHRSTAKFLLRNHVNSTAFEHMGSGLHISPNGIYFPPLR
jgi:synaptobrevin family protein YKT6